MKLKYVKDYGDQVAEMYSDVEMFCDANLNKKGPSTCGGIFRYHGNAITWFCQKQEDSSTSSAESEYKTFGIAFKQGLYFVNLLQGDMKIQITPILVHEDNTAAIDMVNQLRSNSKTAHIENHYHWVREHVQDKKNFKVQHLGTELMCADIFTKALEKGPFEKHRNFIMNHIPDADST
jgi:ribonuclease HI